MDLALGHGYFLAEDPVEAGIMKPYPPLGILYLSAYLKARGYGVGVFDGTFRRAADFGPWLDIHRPSVVGLYATMVTRQAVLKMIWAARARGAAVVMGGPEPAGHPERFLEAGAHVVVIGEGEETLEALMPALMAGEVHGLHGVPGIVFRDRSGAVIHTPPRGRVHDLNQLPWPDREAIDLKAYLDTWRTHHGYSSLSLITARGCPFTCSWCSHAVYGHTHRRRKAEAVVEEIEHVMAQYSPDRLWIADDVFTISRAWTHQWAERMAARGLKVPYECISRADRIDGPIAEDLAATGCRRIWLGSESGNQGLLDEMSRGVTLAQIREATALLQDRGVEVGLFVMVGFGDETPAEVEDTIDHLERTGADDFLITVAYPIKGTAWHRALGRRILEPKDWTQTTDRDARFKGRPSDAYMRMAVRRVLSESRWRRLRRRAPLSPEALKALGRSQLARLGMGITWHLGRYGDGGAPGLRPVAP